MPVIEDSIERELHQLNDQVQTIRWLAHAVFWAVVVIGLVIVWAIIHYAPAQY